MIIKVAPLWKITNLGAGFYDITAFPNVVLMIANMEPNDDRLNGATLGSG